MVIAQRLNRQIATAVNHGQRAVWALDPNIGVCKVAIVNRIAQDFHHGAFDRQHAVGRRLGKTTVDAADVDQVPLEESEFFPIIAVVMRQHATGSRTGNAEIDFLEYQWIDRDQPLLAAQRREIRTGQDQD